MRFRQILIVITVVIFLTLKASAEPFSVRPTVGEDSEYTVRVGDDLLSIARQHRLAIEHLAFANGFPETALDVLPGTILTIPRRRVLPFAPPKNGLVLNVPERGLYLFRDGVFADFIPVSVGRAPEAKTPLGSFSIIEKIIDPTWFPTAGSGETEPVPPGPDNPLGDRWIGLSAQYVGIHGTNDPLNVGAPVTRGCIRCYPEEVRALFPKVQVGMPVRIEYETAKLGKTADGQLVLATFPDLYQTSDPWKRSEKLLRWLKRDDLLSNRGFVQRVQLILGVGVILPDLMENVQQPPVSVSIQGPKKTNEPDQ